MKNKFGPDYSNLATKSVNSLQEIQFDHIKIVISLKISPEIAIRNFGHSEFFSGFMKSIWSLKQPNPLFATEETFFSLLKKVVCLVDNFFFSRAQIFFLLVNEISCHSNEFFRLLCQIHFSVRPKMSNCQKSSIHEQKPARLRLISPN